MVAAQGCKVIAKDLDKALAGLSLYVAENDMEADIYKVRHRGGFFLTDVTDPRLQMSLKSLAVHTEQVFQILERLQY